MIPKLAVRMHPVTVTWPITEYGYGSGYEWVATKNPCMGTSDRIFLVLYFTFTEYQKFLLSK